MTIKDLALACALMDIALMASVIVVVLLINKGRDKE